MRSQLEKRIEQQYRSSVEIDTFCNKLKTLTNQCKTMDKQVEDVMNSPIILTTYFAR